MTVTVLMIDSSLESRPNDKKYLFPPDQLVCYLIRGIIIIRTGLNSAQTYFIVVMNTLVY